MYKSDHTCLRVTDMETERKFYEEALDFTVHCVRQHNKKVRSIFMISPDGGYQLQLVCGQGKESGSAEYGHIAMRAEDIRKSFERHSSMGCVSTQIVEQPYQWGYFIKDPEGYQTEIVQPK